MASKGWPARGRYSDEEHWESQRRPRSRRGLGPLVSAFVVGAAVVVGAKVMLEVRKRRTHDLEVGGTEDISGKTGQFQAEDTTALQEEDVVQLKGVSERGNAAQPPAHFQDKDDDLAQPVAEEPLQMCGGCEVALKVPDQKCMMPLELECQLADSEQRGEMVLSKGEVVEPVPADDAEPEHNGDTHPLQQTPQILPVNPPPHVQGSNQEPVVAEPAQQRNATWVHVKCDEPEQGQDPKPLLGSAQELVAEQDVEPAGTIWLTKDYVMDNVTDTNVKPEEWQMVEPATEQQVSFVAEKDMSPLHENGELSGTLALQGESMQPGQGTGDYLGLKKNELAYSESAISKEGNGFLKQMQREDAGVKNVLSTGDGESEELESTSSVPQKLATRIVVEGSNDAVDWPVLAISAGEEDAASPDDAKLSKQSDRTAGETSSNSQQVGHELPSTNGRVATMEAGASNAKDTSVKNGEGISAGQEALTDDFPDLKRGEVDVSREVDVRLQDNNHAEHSAASELANMAEDSVAGAPRRSLDPGLSWAAMWKWAGEMAKMDPFIGKSEGAAQDGKQCQTAGSSTESKSTAEAQEEHVEDHHLLSVGADKGGDLDKGPGTSSTEVQPGRSPDVHEGESIESEGVAQSTTESRDAAEKNTTDEVGQSSSTLPMGNASKSASKDRGVGNMASAGLSAPMGLQQLLPPSPHRVVSGLDDSGIHKLVPQTGSQGGVKLLTINAAQVAGQVTRSSSQGRRGNEPRPSPVGSLTGPQDLSAPSSSMPLSEASSPSQCGVSPSNTTRSEYHEGLDGFHVEDGQGLPTKEEGQETEADTQEKSRWLPAPTGANSSGSDGEEGRSLSKGWPFQAYAIWPSRQLSRTLTGSSKSVSVESLAGPPGKPILVRESSLPVIAGAAVGTDLETEQTLRFSRSVSEIGGTRGSNMELSKTQNSALRGSGSDASFEGMLERARSASMRVKVAHEDIMGIVRSPSASK